MQGYATYSFSQYHSFEIRRDIILSDFYQNNVLRKFSNFWIENQLLSNIIYYLKSSLNEPEITKNLSDDCNLLKLPIKLGALKNTIAICIAKLIPIKFIIKKIKKGV